MRPDTTFHPFGPLASHRVPCRDPRGGALTWPVINWLLWHSLSLHGEEARAQQLREDSLGQVRSAGDFAEYLEPFTGESAWLPAAVLDRRRHPGLAGIRLALARARADLAPRLRRTAQVLLAGLITKQAPQFLTKRERPAPGRRLPVR